MIPLAAGQLLFVTEPRLLAVAKTELQLGGDSLVRSLACWLYFFFFLPSSQHNEILFQRRTQALRCPSDHLLAHRAALWRAKGHHMDDFSHAAVSRVVKFKQGLLSPARLFTTLVLSKLKKNQGTGIWWFGHHPGFGLSVHLSSHSSIRPSIHRSIHPSSINLSFHHTSLHLSVIQSSICPSVHPSIIHLSFLFIHAFIHPSV